MPACGFAIVGALLHSEYGEVSIARCGKIPGPVGPSSSQAAVDHDVMVGAQRAWDRCWNRLRGREASTAGTGKVRSSPLNATASSRAVSYLRRGRHAARFKRGDSCNHAMMEVRRRRAKRSWTPAHSRAVDAKIDALMTVPRSLPGRREAGPTARTARQTNLCFQRPLHRRGPFLRDRVRV